MKTEKQLTPEEWDAMKTLYGEQILANEKTEAEIFNLISCKAPVWVSRWKENESTGDRIPIIAFGKVSEIGDGYIKIKDSERKWRCFCRISDEDLKFNEPTTEEFCLSENKSRNFLQPLLNCLPFAHDLYITRIVNEDGVYITLFNGEVEFSEDAKKNEEWQFYIVRNGKRLLLSDFGIQIEQKTDGQLAVKMHR